MLHSSLCYARNLSFQFSRSWLSRGSNTFPTLNSVADVQNPSEGCNSVRKLKTGWDHFELEWLEKLSEWAKGGAAPLLPGLPSRNHTGMWVQELPIQQPEWLERRVMESQDGNVVQEGLLCIITAQGKTPNAILLGREAWCLFNNGIKADPLVLEKDGHWECW